MKQLHRTNLILTWVCTVVLTILAAVTSDSAIQSAAVMIGASMIATFVYFIKLNDILKGVLLVDIISFSALTLSILQGGNIRCYIVSFIVIGLAALYFEPKIMFYHLCDLCDIFHNSICNQPSIYCWK